MFTGSVVKVEVVVVEVVGKTLIPPLKAIPRVGLVGLVELLELICSLACLAAKLKLASGADASK